MISEIRENRSQIGFYEVIGLLYTKLSTHMLCKRNLI